MAATIPILDSVATKLAPVLETHVWVARIIVIELLSTYLRITPAELLKRCEGVSRLDVDAIAPI